MTPINHLRRIRFWLSIFISGLFLSGVTAFPLESELHWLVSSLRAGSLLPFVQANHLLPCLERVEAALSAVANGIDFSIASPFFAPV